MSAYSPAPSARSGFARVRSAFLVVTSLLSVFFVAGCGSGTTDTPDNPTPSISSVAPSTVVAGSDPFTLTVSGSGFINGSTIRWNGAARTTTFVSATQLTASISAGDIATDGAAMVTVSNPAPGGGISQASTVTISPPAVASVTLDPTTGSLVPQQNLTLVATPRSEGGAPLAGRILTWSSSDDGVATVSQGGVVLAVAPGSALVRAISEGVEGTAQVTVVQGGMIGPAGGSVSLAGDSIVLEFPAGAVAAPVAITIQAEDTPPASSNLIPGTGYIVGPTGTNFAQPVVVRIRYGGSTLPPGVTPSQLLIHRWTGTTWEPLGNTSVNLGAGTASGTTTTPGTFAILRVLPYLESIEAGGDHSCAVLLGGAGFCWGLGNEGAMGNGSFIHALLPVPVSGGHEFLYISPGFDHNCGLREDFVALCWGAGDSGQIGRGAPGDVSTPQVVLNGPFTSVSSGFDHTCGLKDGGVAHCWGLGSDGGLGNGSTMQQNSPTPVAGGHSFSAIASGGYHTCGLKANGEAWCWGLNEDGQVGDGTELDRTTPVQVVGGHQFVELAAGGYHTCGRRADGSVLCWGWSSGGQLGDGNPGTDSSTPVLVQGGFQFASISAGSSHTCGVTTTGVGYCWGSGGNGRLGNAGTSNVSLPSPVSGGLIFSRISAGDWNSCGLTVNGEGYCWGWGNGAGNGSAANVLVPTPIVLPSAPLAPAAVAPQILAGSKQGGEVESKGRD